MSSVRPSSSIESIHQARLHQQSWAKFLTNDTSLPRVSLGDLRNSLNLVLDEPSIAGTLAATSELNFGKLVIKSNLNKPKQLEKELSGSLLKLPKVKKIPRKKRKGDLLKIIR